jgi:peptidoglycan/LPS O-acetylase OafA/YrhL
VSESGDEPRLVPKGGRVIAIDVVRGFAILWVVLFHLWGDLKFPADRTLPEQFRLVPHQIARGEVYGAATAVFDVFAHVGYLGVSLFMILSGLSLTLVAMRGEMRLTSAPRFLYRRLRRVMIPYWVGFAYAVAFAAAIAWVQWHRLGNHGYTWFLTNSDVPITREQLFAGGLLIPRFWKNSWKFAPEGSTWFVLLIVQYYLLFPLLLPLLKRIGPWLFLALMFAITMVSLNTIVALDGDLLHADSWVQTLAPFRIAEFALGMVGGYLMVTRPQLLIEYTRAPLDIAAIVVLGLLSFIGGGMIEWDSGRLSTLQQPMQALGMALVFLPLVMKIPGRLEVSAMGRAFAWVGVISYTVLIINEPFRSVTHIMHLENSPDGWQVLWIGVLYMPLTMILAYPLAVVLGLTPKALPRDRPQEQAGSPSAVSP